MKKILFLDDMEARHKVFRMGNIGWDVTHVYTAEEAMKALSETVFDLASLDHDLSVETIMLMPDKGKGSGYDVALFIAEMPEEKRPRTVVVHSLNPSGSIRMMDALEGKVNKLLRIPFKS